MGEVRWKAGAVPQLYPGKSPPGSQNAHLCGDAGDLREQGCRQRERSHLLSLDRDDGRGVLFPQALTSGAEPARSGGVACALVSFRRSSR